MKIFFKVFDFLPSRVTNINQSAGAIIAVDEVTGTIITRELPEKKISFRLYGRRHDTLKINSAESEIFALSTFYKELEEKQVY